MIKFNDTIRRFRGFLKKSPAEKSAAIDKRLTCLLQNSGAYELYHRALAHARYWLSLLGARPHNLPQPLIVSLTSYPARFPTLHLTIRTLLAQELGADRVILWLHEPDLSALPTSVTRLAGKKFEIRTVSRNLRSYTKLIPALRAFPSAYLVTADDDTYYKHSWLRELVESHTGDAREVLGHRAHYIAVDDAMRIRPYLEWAWDIQESVADEHVFLTGVGGILYPPGALPPEALDEDVFLELCPTADDVWFYFMSRRNGYIGRKIDGVFSEYTWGNTQRYALGLTNVNGPMNDTAIANLVARFGNPFAPGR